MNDEITNLGREMLFGRHYGKKIETVVIRYPDYACWVLDNMKDENALWIRNYIQVLIHRFDEKPFTHVGCASERDGQPCGRRVTRLVLYRGSAVPQFWCSDCNPEDYPLNRGRITQACEYREALRQVCVEVGTRESQRSLIGAMAAAKGLEGKKTEAKILRFFYGA